MVTEDWDSGQSQVLEIGAGWGTVLPVFVRYSPVEINDADSSKIELKNYRKKMNTFRSQSIVAAKWVSLME